MMRLKASEVLQINDTFTCAGYSYSQRRPCNNHLYFFKRELAEYLLNCMTYYEVCCDDGICGCLRELAFSLLCTPRHEDQVEFLVGTWKRRILWFQRAQMVQDIRNLESTVADITMKLGRSSLSVAQHIVLRSPSRTNARDEYRPPQPRGHYIFHSNTTSPSFRVTTLRADNWEPSDLASDYARNLDGSQYDGSEIYTSTSSSDEASTPPPSAAVRQAPNGNSQSPNPKEAKTHCPICLDAFESGYCVSRCHGCLVRFH